jgi:hypothetical protein
MGYLYMIFKFAKVIRETSQKNYNVGKIIQEYSDLESARNNYMQYKASITDLEVKCNYLNQGSGVLCH